MWETCYFLNVGNLTENKKAILREMEALLDKERLLKYQNVQTKKSKYLSLGAGALIRLAAMEFEAERKEQAVRRLTPEALLKAAGEFPELKNKEIRYRIGKNGKPYFENLPFYFSLSHSGSLVMLGTSEQEIGADVQEIREVDWKKLSDRFYSEEEKVCLQRMNGKNPEKAKEEFHRLWCLKEAYGKWSGEGVQPYLCMPIRRQIKRDNLREGRITCGGITYRHALYREEAEQRDKE